MKYGGGADSADATFSAFEFQNREIVALNSRTSPWASIMGDGLAMALGLSVAGFAKADHADAICGLGETQHMPSVL